MWFIKLLIVLQFVGVFGRPVANKSKCPQFSSFYGYELGHMGCCVDESLCMYPVANDPRLSRQIQEGINLVDLESQRTRRNVEISSIPYTTSSSSAYTLCRSNVSIIKPMFATSASYPQTQVQILQLPPLMTQAIVVHVCEEQETPIVRGFCRQHYKWESVYTVRGNKSTTRDHDGGEVTFQREWILVGAGCDLTFNFNVQGLFNSSYAISNQHIHPNLINSEQNYEQIHSTKILGFPPLSPINSPHVSNIERPPYSSSSDAIPYSDEATPYQGSSPLTNPTTTSTVPVNTTTPPIVQTTTGFSYGVDDLSGREAHIGDDTRPQGAYSPSHSHGSESGEPNLQDVIYSPNSKEPRKHNEGSAATNSRGHPRGYNRNYGPNGPLQVRSVKAKDYYAGRENGQSGTKNSSSEYTGSVYAKPYRRMYQKPDKIGVPVYSMSDNPDRIRSLKSRL